MINFSLSVVSVVAINLSIPHFPVLHRRSTCVKLFLSYTFQSRIKHNFVLPFTYLSSLIHFIFVICSQQRMIMRSSLLLSYFSCAFYALMPSRLTGWDHTKYCCISWIKNIVFGHFSLWFNESVIGMGVMRLDLLLHRASGE